MSDTTEPAPLTEREMNQFVTLAALPTLERALERLRWLEAQNAALKANDPLAEMWRELSEYQPMADRDGHGESWRRMCSERTEAAAEEAANCVRDMSEWDAAWAVARIAKWAGDAVAAIRCAKEAKR
jgi:hypothetical protein